jgi:tyrosinase
VRVRKNVWKLAQGDDTLTWFARGAAAMQAKPITEPTSWRYQAAVHEYDPAGDPLTTPGEVLPPGAEQDRFWTQCQHGTWFFLPWHRMYLHHFEEMVAAEVARLGGPSDWGLPYWNYSEPGQARLVPPAFRAPTLPGGEPNALFVEARDPRCNAGEPFADDRDVDLGALGERVYQSPAMGGSGFGGPPTRFEHSGGAIGALEGTPHGSMHVAVGGLGGWMGAFNTAALDPLFWLHHANIDRLWEVWRRAAGHADPTASAWLGAVSFPFRSASGEVVTMTPAQVLDTTAPPFSYAYDDAGAPAGPAAPEALAATMAAPPGQPELVGATAAPFELGDDATHQEFATHAPRVTAQAQLLAAGPRQPRRVFLSVENLTAAGRSPAYDVYFNVPKAADPHQHEHLFAGRLPMFGLAEASRASGKQPGSGLHYALDITSLFGRLSAAPGWDPGQVRVSFVPTRKQAGAKVRVGRVSLYFE